ncbi:unnamed protein product [Trichobilharzia regenti]|nr:unnamed protein product [Trichobilharzia regenti]
MAGIGQYTMGRAMVHDYNKPVTTYGSNFTKRPLFGTGNSVNAGTPPSFSDIATLSTTGYNSRPGSSQRNGEIVNPVPNAFPGRTTYPTALDSSLENGPSYFYALNYNGNQTGPPRNFSESALFSSLSTVSRTAGNELTNNRVGNIAPSIPMNTAMAMASNRNPGSLYSNSVGNDNSPSNPTNLSLSSSSRGVTLDPSEFPPILTSTGRSGNASTTFHSSASQPPLRNYVSIMSKGSSNIDQSLSQMNQQFNHSSNSQAAPLEFSKQDFPALPGSHQPTTSTTTTVSTTSALTVNSTSATHRSLSASSVTQTPASTNSRRLFSHTPNQVMAQSSSPNQPSYSNVPSKSVGASNGIQLLPNHLVTNIPKNMICDQFGMLGLLKLIRVGDYDATLNMLAPGLDLSSLHNNWQTSG